MTAGRTGPHNDFDIHHLLEEQAQALVPPARAVQECLVAMAVTERRDWEYAPAEWLVSRVGHDLALSLGMHPFRVSPSPFLGPLAMALPAGGGRDAVLLYGAQAPGETARIADRLVAYRRALADAILALLQRRALIAGEWVRELGLAPATVSYHLARLREVGLASPVAAEDEPTRWRLDFARLREYGRLVAVAAGRDLPRRPPRGDQPARTPASYFRDGRLVGIPRNRARRERVLREISRSFDPGVSYTEAEVNAVLRRFHDDRARFRRELVEAGHLVRDGGRYRRVSGGWARRVDNMIDCGGGVSLRLLERRDTETVARWLACRPDGVWAAGQDFLVGPEQVQRWHERVLGREDEMMLAIELAEGEPVLVGYLAFRVDWRHREGQVGAILVAEPWRGRGVASRALGCLFEVLFTRWRLNRISLLAHADNRPALALYRSLGMVEEGRLRRKFLFDGTWCDMVVFSMLDDERSAIRRVRAGS